MPFWRRTRTSLERSYEGWKLLSVADKDLSLEGGSLERSYEGWKQQHDATTVSKTTVTSGLERSYEGWKPMSSTPYSSTLQSLERSYEGWKRK